MILCTEAILSRVVETYQRRICQFSPERLAVEQAGLARELQRFPGEPVRLQKLAVVKTMLQTAPSNYITPGGTKNGLCTPDETQNPDHR